ncbi:MAG: hypothetical protein WC760_02470 [Bacteroidia bacterium]
MNLKNILLWTPRVLGILLTCFVSLFAMDAFNTDHPVTADYPGLFMHLLPTLLILVMLLISWKKPLFGGILFILLGFAYSFKSLDHLNWILVIGLPVFLIGALFIFSHLLSQKQV